MTTYTSSTAAVPVVEATQHPHHFQAVVDARKREVLEQMTKDRHRPVGSPKVSMTWCRRDGKGGYRRCLKRNADVRTVRVTQAAVDARPSMSA